MSRQPSPGPPSSLANQMYHQPPPPASSSKQRTKPFTNSLPGGAEDVKYQAKYKELKKKVKEIELDNDRLYLKLLLAKKNIRRMNLERAILYERLAQVPPTPGRHTQELPPEHDPMYAQQPSGLPDSSHSVDPHDQALQDYLRSNPNARSVYGQDGRVVAIEDPTAAANGTREHSGGSGPPPPYGLPLVQGYHEQNTQLPPLPLPVPSIREPHDEPSTSNNHGYLAAQRTTTHSNNNSAHHSRGASARADRDAAQVEPSRLDTLPARHGAHSRSSSASGEGHGESRSRRADLRDLTSQQGPPPAQSHTTHPEPEALLVHPHSPTQGRIHNHQRMGPGVHLHRQQERDPEVTRQLMREREAEREREREREAELRVRMAAEEEEEMRQYGMWPAQPHVRDGSHSDSTGTGGGSGSGSGSRPSSGHSHERTTRPYAPRVANLLVSESESYYDSRDERIPGSLSNTRGYPQEQAAPPPSESTGRKRTRHDMDVDGEYSDARSPAHREGSAAGSADAYPRSHEMRGSKRVHADDDDVSLGRVSSVRDERMDQDD